MIIGEIAVALFKSRRPRGRKIGEWSCLMDFVAAVWRKGEFVAFRYSARRSLFQMTSNQNPKS